MSEIEIQFAHEQALSIDPSLDWKRSNPDRILYLPKGGNHADTDNEHFLVFPSPDGEQLLALWTQSSVENFGNNHIMFARSDDGINWAEPKVIAGTTSTDSSGLQASWGFPIVTRKGRIYCFYLNETGRIDIDRATTGTMGCIYSDDTGETWINAGCVTMPRHPLDHPDPLVPKNWIAWQIPIRLQSGAVFTGYTHWTSRHWQDKPPLGWYSRDSRSHFMRFENIDEHPTPDEIRITWLPVDGKGIEVPFPDHSNLSVAQEPAVVQLPDGRIFCTMRTFTGYIWYALSADEGATWTQPEILKDRDGGTPIKQPIASCPLYALRDGRYLLVYHNNDGNLGPWKPHHALHNRRPAFCAVGTYQPSASQPIWFEAPILFVDTDGIPIGPKGTSEIATYPSLTEWKGERILWYPDRKYYLLGKKITDAFLSGISSGAAHLVPFLLTLFLCLSMFSGHAQASASDSDMEAGWNALDRMDWQTAAKSFQHTVANAPEAFIPEALYGLGLTQAYTNPPNTDAALATFDRIIRTFPDDPCAGWAALETAQLKERTGRIDSVALAETLKQISQDYKGHPVAHEAALRTGLSLMEVGRGAEALRYLDTYVHDNPSNSEAPLMRFLLAYWNMEIEQNYEAALPFLLELAQNNLAESRRRAMVFWAIAQIYRLHRNEPEVALQWYNRITEEFPNEVTTGDARRIVQQMERSR